MKCVRMRRQEKQKCASVCVTIIITLLTVCISGFALTGDFQYFAG